MITLLSFDMLAVRFESIVVNQTSASFYQNAEFIGARPLRRPVTDCIARTLEVGAAGTRLGDISIYPRGCAVQDVLFVACCVLVF